MHRHRLAFALLVPLVLVFCAVAGHALAQCAPAQGSDGGSVCLPKGWAVMPWDDAPTIQARLGDDAVLCDQTVFAARSPGAREEATELVINRMAAVLPSGGLLDVEPIDERAMTVSAAAKTPREALHSPPSAVSAGGRTLWRMVRAEPGQPHLKAIYRVFAHRASYQIMLAVPLARKDELPALERELLDGWTPGSGPIRLPAATVGAEWLEAASPHLPGVRMALPGDWEIDTSGDLERVPLDGGSVQHRVVALDGRGEAAEHGRAWLEARILWATDAAGAPLVMSENTALEFGDAVLAGLRQRFGMTRTGAARETAGRLPLGLRFFSLARRADTPPLGAVSAIIPGARRVVVLTLVHEASQAAYWRSFLLEMMRRWELTPQGADLLLPLVQGS